MKVRCEQREILHAFPWLESPDLDHTRNFNPPHHRVPPIDPRSPHRNGKPTTNQTNTIRTFATCCPQWTRMGPANTISVCAVGFALGLVGEAVGDPLCTCNRLLPTGPAVRVRTSNEPAFKSRRPIKAAASPPPPSHTHPQM